MNSQNIFMEIFIIAKEIFFPRTATLQDLAGAIETSRIVVGCSNPVQWQKIKKVPTALNSKPQGLTYERAALLDQDWSDPALQYKISQIQNRDNCSS